MFSSQLWKEKKSRWPIVLFHSGTLLQQRCVCCHLPPLHTPWKWLMAKWQCPTEKPLRAVWNRRWRSHCIFGGSTPLYQLLWAWQEQRVPKAATVSAALCMCTMVKRGLKTEILGPVSKLSCWTKIAQLYKRKKNLKTTTKKCQSGARCNKVQHFLMTQKGP